MKRKTTPPRQATATDESADAVTTVARGLERCLEHLAAVMPGLPQLGIAMILLSVAIAASRALQAPADSGSDAVSASTPGPEAGFDEAPFRDGTVASR
jgi:hypothetical protein